MSFVGGEGVYAYNVKEKLKDQPMIVTDVIWYASAKPGGKKRYRLGGYDAEHNTNMSKMVSEQFAKDAAKELGIKMKQGIVKEKTVKKRVKKTCKEIGEIAEEKCEEKRATPKKKTAVKKTTTTTKKTATKKPAAKKATSTGTRGRKPKAASSSASSASSSESDFVTTSSSEDWSEGELEILAAAKKRGTKKSPTSDKFVVRSVEPKKTPAKKTPAKKTPAKKTTTTAAKGRGRPAKK